MLVFISNQVAREEEFLLKTLAIIVCFVHELQLYSRDHFYVPYLSYFRWQNELEQKTTAFFKEMILSHAKNRDGIRYLLHR